MVRSIGAQVGLLAFGIAILAGLHAGNTVSTVLWRAVLVMLLGSLVGQAVGWVGKLVLRDHLQRKKLSLDQAHHAAVQPLTEASAAAEAAAPTDGG